MTSPDRRIVLINRYFYPDSSATSQMLSDLAFFLAEAGWDVNVVTSVGAFDDPEIRFSRFEQIRGVMVYRVGPAGSPGASLAARALTYIKLYCVLGFETFRRARSNDIVVIKTDPPLLGVSLAPVVKLKRLRQINWLQDLYPEIAIELGVVGLNGAIGRALKAIRNIGLRRARMNVAIGEHMFHRLSELGVAEGRMTVIPNWCNDETIVPQSEAANTLRREWGLEDKFVIGYSGTLGRAHEIDTVLAAASILRDEPGLVFLLIGGGFLRAKLKREVEARGLGAMFQFRPYQEANQLPQSLCVPDIHWLSLNPKMEGLIVPSKFYGIAAAGKAMIAVMAEDGEISSLIRQSGCGAVVTPGDGAGFARVVQAWRHQPELLADKGRKSRDLIDQFYRRRTSLSRWHSMVSIIDDRPV